MSSGIDHGNANAQRLAMESADHTKWPQAKGPTPENKPLLSERMRAISSRMGNAEAYAIMQGLASDAEVIEAARAKDQELIQMAVDLDYAAEHEEMKMYWGRKQAFQAAAKAAGFTPSANE